MDIKEYDLKIEDILKPSIYVTIPIDPTTYLEKTTRATIKASKKTTTHRSSRI